MSTPAPVLSQQTKPREEIYCFGAKTIVTLIMPSVHVLELLDYFGLTEHGFPINKTEATVTRGKVTQKRENNEWVVEFTFSERYARYFYEALQRFSLNKKLEYHGPTYSELAERDIIIGNIRSLLDQIKTNKECYDNHLSSAPKS